MAEQKTLAATGNIVVAEAMRQCAPDVMAAYPITPQTTIVEEFAKFVAQGRVHTEYVTVESEHSAMSACVGASAAGARVMTATSSQGLALMWEELHIAAGMRLPIVMANANRALSAPINIHCDHSDIMGARDTGWIILFAETAQEAYDNTIMSVPHRRAPRRPAAGHDLPRRLHHHALDRPRRRSWTTRPSRRSSASTSPSTRCSTPTTPSRHGSFAGLGGPYFEFKRSQRDAIDRTQGGRRARRRRSGRRICGRPFDLIETWGMEDADVAIVVIGSTAGNARHVATQLRAEGVEGRRRQGPLLPPVPRSPSSPRRCKGMKAVAVLDRAESFGAEGGPLFLEVRSALYDLDERVPRRQLHLRPRRLGREARAHAPGVSPTCPTSPPAPPRPPACATSARGRRVRTHG